MEVLPKIIEFYSNNDYSSLNETLDDDEEVISAGLWLADHPEFVLDHLDIVREVKAAFHPSYIGFPEKQTITRLFHRALGDDEEQVFPPAADILELPVEKLQVNLTSNQNFLIQQIKLNTSLFKELVDKLDLVQQQSPEISQESIKTVIKDLFSCKTLNSDDLRNIHGNLVGIIAGLQLILNTVSLSSEEKQNRYMTEFDKAVDRGTELIKQNTPFEQLTDYFSDQRHNIAESLLHTPIGEFGVLRDHHSLFHCTHVTGKFDQYFEDYHHKIPSESRDYNNFLLSQDYDLKTSSVEGVTIREKIDGDEVELTQLLLAKTYETHYENELVFGSIPDKYPSIGLIHCDIDTSKKILSYVKKLYNKFNENNLSVDESLKKVAEIEWWMVHAMPWKRGSASIAEMLTKSLLRSKGIEASWDDTLKPQNKQLDMEVFVTPLNEFIIKFPDFIKYQVL